MKMESRLVRLWEVGDIVRTGYGVGIVCRVEECVPDWSIANQFQDVWVQHKDACSENTSNRPVLMEGEHSLHLIGLDEYNAD